jgi:nicotinamide-nucleotide amidase
MQAIILSVGDELVLGQTVDTNSAWISQQLAAVGCDIAAHMTVPDDQRAIEQAMLESAGRCDVLIVSGGIGPTEDDLTRQALAAVMNAPLEINETWLAELEKFFAARGRPMPPINRIQAMIPRGATMIFNHAGTAAGIHAVISSSTAAHASEPEVSPESLVGRPLGRVLTKMGKVTREQVIEALSIQKRKGGLIGEILVKLGYVSVEDVLFAVAAQGMANPPAGETLRPADLPTGQRAGDEHLERMFGDPDRADKMDALREFTEHDLAARREALKAARGRRRQTDVFVMPGVPKEMKAMFMRDVLPHIAEQSRGAVILSRTLHTYGMGESAIGERLGTQMMRGRNPSVGTTVSEGQVSIRVNARYPSLEEARQQLEATCAACVAALGDLIYGQDDDDLPHVVGKLLQSQPEGQNTIATAESCTGGLLAKMLTDVPGSSEYFDRGWVTYDPSAKAEVLGVGFSIIREHGVVSEPVATAMANGARVHADAAFGIGITGVAGPGGGTEKSPVGTVCIALTWRDGSTARTFNFPGDREMIRDRAAKMALTMLRFKLLGKKLPF